MVYMVVDEHTSDLLHLKRSPGIRSWSLLVGMSKGEVDFMQFAYKDLHQFCDTFFLFIFLSLGIVSVGLAAAYYSSDNVFWKLFYVTGCVFVALQNMEEWEEASFDKKNSVIELKTFSLYAMILTLWKKGQEKVLLDLRHLRDISVQEEKVRYLGTGYVLVLRMATGFSHPLTQNATLSGRSDVDALSTLLKRFLELEALQQNLSQDDEDCKEDDEEFEQLGLEGDDESSDSSDHQERAAQ